LSDLSQQRSGGPENITLVLEVKREMKVPAKVKSHEEFADALLRFYEALRPPNLPSVHPEELLCRGYYALGWLVGDATKQFARGGTKARTGTCLCKRHPENLELGEYFSNCVNVIGVPSRRIADEAPRPAEPHGSFRWLSSYSPVISWLKTACLGLGRHELTSYVPVRMVWLLTSPKDFRLWFLRGLADSDGTVNLRNKSVSIVTAPNTLLVRKLFDSLGCHNTYEDDDGVGVVTISAPDAMHLQIFNPEVLTHRRKALESLCSAATFERRWPDWLEARVRRLVEEGRSPRSIRDRLLFEDKVYVKIKTLKTKQRLYGE
jgi:hypothetical protein